MGTLRITTIRGDEKNMNKLLIIYLFYFRILSKVQAGKNAFIDVKIIAEVILSHLYMCKILMPRFAAFSR